MNKTKQNKIRKQIIGALKSKKLYEATDDILIDLLIRCMVMEDYAKDKLISDPDSWGSTTLHITYTKQIQSILTKLALTPNERAKIVASESNAVDVHKLINGEEE